VKKFKLNVGLCISIIFVFSVMGAPLFAQGDVQDPEKGYPIEEVSYPDIEKMEKELDTLIEEALAEAPGIKDEADITCSGNQKRSQPSYNFTHKDDCKAKKSVMKKEALTQVEKQDGVIVIKAKATPEEKGDSQAQHQIDHLKEQIDTVLDEETEMVSPKEPEAIVIKEDTPAAETSEEVAMDETPEDVQTQAQLPPMDSEAEIVIEEEPGETQQAQATVDERMEAIFSEMEDLLVQEKVERQISALEDPDDFVEEKASPPAKPKKSFEEKVGDQMHAAMEKSEEEKREDYWNKEIRKQTISQIQSHLKIDQAFKEAKAVKLPESNNKKAEDAEIVRMMMTPQEVVSSIINPEVADVKIDLDFDNTNLQDILMTLGATGGLNIVLDPILKNSKLDLHLKKVTIEESLLLVANTYDLGYKRVGDSLFVTQREKLKEENVVSKLFKLKNVSVEEAKDMVTDLIKTVSYSNELNSLLVVGNPEDIIEVERILNKIDKPQPQVVLEAKIIEINKDALKELGIDFSDQILLSYQESARPQDFENVEDSPGSAMEVFSIARNPIQLDTTIKMLENQNKARVLSNPRITTLNDKEAEIFVGDRIPYTVSNVTGGVVTTDVRWVEPGIRLIITPTIIEDDFVVVKVEPEVSFIFSFLGPNDEYPRVKTREATANVRIKNGQPFVIGGLLNQEDKQNLYKVPILGDIPLIGNLFSYESHTIEDTELIITIIPRIVQGEE